MSKVIGFCPMTARPEIGNVRLVLWAVL